MAKKPKGRRVIRKVRHRRKKVRRRRSTAAPPIDLDTTLMHDPEHF